MKLKWTYQYISLNQPEQKILQTLRKCTGNGILPILDVEDSLQIPLDPIKTKLIKERARQILGRVLSLGHENKIPIHASIRINAQDTNEFGNDMSMLRDLEPMICWDSIFLPKVHSAGVLQHYVTALKGIRFGELVVMAESRAFFENAGEIVTQCKQFNVSKVHFGHWDYFFDLREFPVPLPDDSILLETVSSLISMLEGHGIHYIHTPYCFLMQHDCLLSIARYLDGVATLPFGLTTLSFSQALAVSRSRDKAPPLIPRTYCLSQEDKLLMARELVAFFNRPVSPEFSFNIDTEIYRFYAPHEYLNALDYLERNKG
jgi:hypothetical protein